MVASELAVVSSELSRLQLYCNRFYQVRRFKWDIYLPASAWLSVGALGALHFSSTHLHRVRPIPPLVAREGRGLPWPRGSLARFGF